MSHRNRLTFGLIVVLLLSAIAGCLRPVGCPDGGAVADSMTVTPTVEPYVGRGDPYAPGSLAVRTVNLDCCVIGVPVPLLIYAPETPGAYPIVVFFHGFLSRNVAYSEILRHVASHGFVVVAPQMYEPGLPALLGNPSAAEEADVAGELLEALPGRFDTLLGYAPAGDRVGLAGHSRGGKVAWLVLTADASRARAVAGVDLVDGTGGPLGNQARVVQGPFAFSLPALVIGTGLGGDCAPVGDNHEQFYAASASPAWHIVVPDHGHGDMLDEDAAAAAGVPCSTGPNRAAMRQLTAGLLTAFFRASLQGDATAYDYLTDTDAAPLAIEVESK
ncbi:MAG: dienelactone hydrolase family protein [Phycisphaerae bacterium]|jgi:chlorophyllase